LIVWLEEKEKKPDHVCYNDEKIDLIVTCDKIDDTTFRDNFFLAYRQIIKPDQLMEKLLRRFKEASPDQDPTSFVPNIRASSINVTSLVTNAASGRDLSARRGSITGREKRVGLKATAVAAAAAKDALSSSSSSVASVAPPAPFVLIPENPLRRVTVARVLRRWLLHSPMDFDSRLAGANGGKKREMTSSRLASKSFGNLRGQVRKLWFFQKGLLLKSCFLADGEGRNLHFTEASAHAARDESRRQFDQAAKVGG
jgi:hypothetical protein